MNKLISIILLLTVGCGPTKQLCDANPDMYEVCNGLFGFNDNYDQNVRDKEQDSRLTSVERNLSELEALYTESTRIETELTQLANSLMTTNGSLTSINNTLIQLQNSLSIVTNGSLENRVTQLELDRTGLLVSIGSLETRVNNTQVTIGSLQTTVLNQQSAIAVLQSHLYVVGYVDFCGDNPSYVDEIGIRLSDNSVVVYFKNNSKEFLTKLYPGTFSTTDGTNCIFTVHNNMSITW